MTEQNQPVADEEYQEIKPTEQVRNTVEDAIAKRREEEEIKESQGQTLETPAEPDAEPTQEAPENVSHETQHETVQVKIEGQVYEVPKERIEQEGGVEAFQKKAAADLIFRRAKEREEQANQLLAAARQTTPQQQVTEPENKLVQAVEALRFNANPEEAARAVRELVGGNQLTPEMIAQIADNRYAHRRAVDKFQSEFPDIVKDPILLNVASQMENHLLAQGRKDYDVMFAQIGKHLTDWRGNLTGNFKDKQEKKQTITNIPQARAKATAPEQPRELTPSEIIAQERKARKQA